ncbi:FecR family protein [Sphingobacterium bovistauri]|uniref:FecR family protein n=1 Tax=Sphingobacterium bovistauri TaxID=2781959 RepID=A0ABS7Z4N8_9SPHI|nr:FecR family protein [Sphingobacterium bovistauri]MCA5003719.1 FecR family protein [Sphingobacterium bovistauri]
MKDNEYFTYLLDKYVKEVISKEECDQLYQFIRSSEYDHIITDDIYKKLTQASLRSNEQLSADESDIVFREILKNSKSLGQQSRFSIRKIGIYITSIAALITLVGLGWLFFYKYPNITKHKDDYLHNDLVYFNDSDTIQQIVLADQSTVDLYPSSNLTYPLSFTDNIRKVTLIGKAFFTITEDKSKPFIVLSGKLRTKVLGTSFLVNSNLKDGIDEVEVRTGLVEVREVGGNLVNDSALEKAVLLTPNQKGVYNIKSRALNKTLITSPQPLIQKNNSIDVSRSEKNEYDQERISEIFKMLETTYGVRIYLDNSDLNGCTFTGSLSDTNLFSKLKIICLATNSSYEVIGTDIIIKGSGCEM